MTTEQPKWEISEDRRTLTISFPTRPPTSFYMDAATLEGFFHYAAHMRSMMDPPVSTDDPRGKKVEAIMSPMWAVAADLLVEQPLLHIRDPRFGVLSYSFTPEQARHLGEKLMQMADVAPPAQSPREAN